jgi:hypothetical protein
MHVKLRRAGRGARSSGDPAIQRAVCFDAGVARIGPAVLYPAPGLCVSSAIHPNTVEMRMASRGGRCLRAVAQSVECFSPAPPRWSTLRRSGVARWSRSCWPTIGGIHTRAAARAMAVMHVNGGMQVVCAAPTAGSAGVIPGMVVTLAEEKGLSRGQRILLSFSPPQAGQACSQSHARRGCRDDASGQAPAAAGFGGCEP